MKYVGLLFVTLSLFLSCVQPSTKPKPPNINWTPFDEPPMFPDCPKEDTKENLHCFSEILQHQLDQKFDKKSLSGIAIMDTLFITLKVDTIGQLSIIGYSNINKNTISPIVFSAVEDVVASLPRFQPAFKTNLEIPVEVSWTLPIYVSK